MSLESMIIFMEDHAHIFIIVAILITLGLLIAIGVHIMRDKSTKINYNINVKSSNHNDSVDNLINDFTTRLKKLESENCNCSNKSNDSSDKSNANVIEGFDNVEDKNYAGF